MNTMELIRSRRSVRSFDGRAIPEREKEDLLRFVSSAETPYKLPIEWRLLDAGAQGLSCPVITGTDIYLAGKMLPTPHAEEAFGFAFERAALYALSKGIGTTCIAGTMDRPAFERAMELSGGEVMPCITPLGYPAAKMSLRESMMRKGVRADSRLGFAELFFDSGFSAPLTEEKAGEFADALEMVRLAPSAVNKQPWRAVVCGSTVHFYEKRSKGFITAQGWDVQKIDMGIALCHFVCGLEEQGCPYSFAFDEPGLEHGADTVYIASVHIG